jgi:hypothetical protein
VPAPAPVPVPALPFNIDMDLPQLEVLLDSNCNISKEMKYHPWGC